MLKEFDYIIIGAGIYGLYSSKILLSKGYKVALIDCEDESFKRASYINQARLHRGYHYPRSISTAQKSEGYYNRFYEDFHFAVNNKFTKIYGISSKYSLTSAEQFKKFCSNINIPCEETNTAKYFNPVMVEQAFLTDECTFDAVIIKKWFIEELKGYKNFSLYFSFIIKDVEVKGNNYHIKSDTGIELESSNVINATYAGVNQICEKFNLCGENLKYEISEIILCDVSDNLKEVGITVMDGPFFSVMPFGLTKVHSITSVMFTHHKASYDYLPVFQCQEKNLNCTPHNLSNCNTCTARPNTAFKEMNQLAKKYLNDISSINYVQSLFSIKPILKRASMDDSRPTLIKTLTESPRFITVLSGKINTMYDLDSVLV